MIEWKEIDWKEASYKLANLQENLVRMVGKDNNEVARIQQQILNSTYIYALAIRHVANHKSAPGVDGKTWTTDDQKRNALRELTSIMKKPWEYKSKPLRRVYIPKANGKRRPLGIPTMMDRAVQTVYLYALDPVVEVTSDLNSYAYRKHRSTHDAVLALRGKLIHPESAEYILSADIEGCFDNISHKFVLDNLPVYRKCDKHVFEQWLKAGVMENQVFKDTTDGTPQGGIISPMLANMVLNGLEVYIKSKFTKTYKGPDGKPKNRKIHVVRYADDIWAIAPEKETLTKIKQYIKEFLHERGLNLNQRKTSISHIRDGFKALGFSFKKVKFDPRKAADIKKHYSNYRIKVVPQKENVKEFLAKLRNVLRTHKNETKIVMELNPIIRGWTGYYSITNYSANVCRKLSHNIFKLLWKWTKRKHPTRSAKWRKERYFAETYTMYRGRKKRRKWTFVAKTIGKRKYGDGMTKLFNPSVIKAPEQHQLNLKKNPYIKEDESYFLNRKLALKLGEERRKVARKQKFKCAHCNGLMHGIEFEIHHNPPITSVTEGSQWNGKLEAMHKDCHRQLHKSDE